MPPGLLLLRLFIQGVYCADYLFIAESLLCIENDMQMNRNGFKGCAHIVQ